VDYSLKTKFTRTPGWTATRGQGINGLMINFIHSTKYTSNCLLFPWKSNIFVVDTDIDTRYE